MKYLQTGFYYEAHKQKIIGENLGELGQTSKPANANHALVLSDRFIVIEVYGNPGR